MSKSFSDQLDEILGVEIKRPSWVGIRHQLSRTNLVWIRRSEYEAMVRNLLALIEKEKKDIKIFGTWLAIDMGAVVEFEPYGMWGQRVWQNRHTFICSGSKKSKESSSITDHLDYRFTEIGDGSVGDEYSDIFLTGKDIKRWFEDENRKPNEIDTIGGVFVSDSFNILKGGNK